MQEIMSGDNTPGVQSLGTDPAQTVFCQSCKEAYSYLYGEDCMPTALTCGHFLCFRCVKSQWNCPNSCDASVFCVECSAQMRISTFQPAHGQTEAKQEVLTDGTVQAVGEGAACSSDGSDALPVEKPVSPEQGQMSQPTCTPSKQFLAGQDQTPPGSRETRDTVTTQVHYQLPPERLPNQDDAWRLQNDEGFIRDWIVANVPDHVIFKMVGGGSQDSSSVSNTDSYCGSADSTGNIVSVMPRMAVSASSSTPLHSIPLPGMSSFIGESTPRQTPEKQFWGSVVNRAAHNKHMQYVRESRGQHLQPMPQVLGHSSDGSRQIEKQCLEESEDKEAGPVTPQTAHGSPAPSISGVFPPQSREDMEKMSAVTRIEEQAMDVGGASQHAVEAGIVAAEGTSQPVLSTGFAGDPVVGMNEQKSVTELHSSQYSTSATQTAVSTTYSHAPASTYSMLDRGYSCVESSHHVYPQYKVPPPAARQYHTSLQYQEQMWDRTQETAIGPTNYSQQRMYSHPHQAVGRPVQYMRPGVCYPYAYPYACPYSQQEKNVQHYQQNWSWHHRHNPEYEPGYLVSQNYPQRTRGRRLPFGPMREYWKTAPCPWNSGRYAASVNLSPEGKVCTLPQLQIVQVVRQKAEAAPETDESSFSIATASGGADTSATVVADGTSVLPSSQTEAEVALMQTRDMPSGTKVGEIYVVPQVWLCERVHDYTPDDRPDVNSQNLAYEIRAAPAVKEEVLTELHNAQEADADPSEQGSEQGREAEAVQGQPEASEQVVNTAVVEMADSQPDQIKSITSTQNGFGHCDFHPVAVLTSVPASVSREQLVDDCMPQLTPEPPQVSHADFHHEHQMEGVTHETAEEQPEIPIAAGETLVYQGADGTPGPPPLIQVEGTEDRPLGGWVTEQYVAVSSNTEANEGMVTDSITDGRSVTVLAREDVLVEASTPTGQTLLQTASESIVEANGRQISCEQSSISDAVTEAVDSSQRTPDVAVGGDVQILEEGSTCPSQILLTLQNPLESPQKPRYRRNLVDAFHNVSRGMTHCTGLPTRGLSYYGRSRGRCGRRGRIRRGACFPHVYHGIHGTVAESFHGGYDQCPLQQGQPAYGVDGSYYQAAVGPAYQTLPLTQAYSSTHPVVPPSRPASHLGQQVCAQQPYALDLGVAQTTFSANLSAQLQASVARGSQVNEQQQYQAQPSWSSDARSYQRSLTDPYPHLYVNSERVPNGGVNPYVTVPANQTIRHHSSTVGPPQQQIFSGSEPQKEPAPESEGAHSALESTAGYTQRHYDSTRPTCLGGTVGDSDTHGKKTFHVEMSACGDTGQTQLQQYLSAEDGQLDGGSTTVQWLLQQVTQLNDKMTDAPGLHQLLGCLMLLSAVRSRLQDGSQPVDPELSQQAQNSDMDCLLKSILSLGYDVIGCGRALLSRQADSSCQESNENGDRSSEIMHLVSSWFQYLVQQMNRMISFYLDQLCSVKSDGSSTPAKSRSPLHQPAQVRLVEVINSDPHLPSTSAAGPFENRLTLETGSSMQPGGMENAVSSHASEASVSVMSANSCEYKEPGFVASPAEVADRALVKYTDTVQDVGVMVKAPSLGAGSAADTITSDEATAGIVRHVLVSYGHIPGSDGRSHGFITGSNVTSTAEPVLDEKEMEHKKLVPSIYTPGSAVDGGFQGNVFPGSQIMTIPKPEPSFCFQLEHEQDVRRISEDASFDHVHAQSTGTQTANVEKSCTWKTENTAVTSVSSNEGNDKNSVESLADSRGVDLLGNISEDVQAICNFLVSSVAHMAEEGQRAEHEASVMQVCRSAAECMSDSQSSSFQSSSAPDRIIEQMVVCSDQAVHQEETHNVILGPGAQPEMDGCLCTQDVIADSAIIMSETVEVETEGLMYEEQSGGEQPLDSVPGAEVDTRHIVNAENLEMDWRHEDKAALNPSPNKKLQQTESDQVDEQPTECGRRLRSRRSTWRSNISADLSPERVPALRTRKRASGRKSQSVQTS